MADTTETTTVHDVEVVRYDDSVIIAERVAVAAFIAAARIPPDAATPRIFGSSPAGAMTAASTC